MHNTLFSDKARDDFKEIKREMQTISEKLKSQMASGEEGIDLIRSWRFYGTLQNRLCIGKSEIK